MTATPAGYPSEYRDEAGVLMRRDVRPFTLTLKGVSRVVQLPGWYPDGDGEGHHVGADLEVTDAALRSMRAELGEPVDGPQRRVIEPQQA